MSATSENVSYYHNVKYSSIQQLHRTRKMHGMKRVIVFCIFTVILPAILIITPLYLRHSVFADLIYQVAESDIIEIRDGISSIFCEKHALHMDTTFNAFQLQSKPEISTNRKHIRLKKSMTLPDDTLEYWGFYLLKGAIVKLKVCSRYDGSRILLVKGDRNLKTCGLLEHNKNKFNAHFAGGYGIVNVTFESIAEVVVSEEIKPSTTLNQDHTNIDGLDNLNIGQNKKNSNSNRSSSNIQKRNRHMITSVTEIKKTINKDHENNDKNDENNGGEDLSDDDNSNTSNKNNNNRSSLVNKFPSKYENKIFNILESDNDQKKKNASKIENIFSDKNVNSGHNDASSTIRLETGIENLYGSNESVVNNNSNISSSSSSREKSKLDDNKRIRHKRYYIKKQLQKNHQYKNNVEKQKEYLKILQNEHDNRKKEIIKQLFDENNRNFQSQKYQKHHQQHDHEKNMHFIEKRDTVYDAKIAHGGNALNFTETESNSVSSFENSLLTCYDGQILLAKNFNPSSLCTSVNYLTNSTHMVATHEVQEDGYYYYIFYSDNDQFRNDIHAIFDIYKPTYQYTNVTDSKGCVNETDCIFPIKFLSDEIVVVEVPTRDGIEHEEDDITYLISTCHPRMSVYVIFPISVLILILSCSFL